MATAEHREPCDSRGSCRVLGAPGGEIPPGDSTSIARRNVEAMGGTIAAENRIPHGLAVHVRLPLAPGGD